MLNGLCNQQTVKGIPVVKGKLLGAGDFVQFQRKLPKAVPGHQSTGEVLRCPLQVKLADASLDRDLPNGNQTEKDLVPAK